MKTMLVGFTLAIALQTAATAREATVSAKTLMVSPRDYLSKEIRVPRVNCIEDPKGGFVCMAKVNGRLLKIDALLLGPATSVPVAELLIERCKGTVKLNNPECLFDIVITPATIEQGTKEAMHGTTPAMTVHSREIEMFRPRR